MQQLTALRPLITASAAALGASLIALTPAVSNDLAADLQHSAAATQQRAVELLNANTGDPGVVNPIQTWMDVFQQAGTNLQTIYDTWSQTPFPLAQQVAANWISYADLYVSTYQTAAFATENYFIPTPPSTSGSFFVHLSDAVSLMQAGNFVDGVQQLEYAVWNNPFTYILQGMEQIPYILSYASQNFANSVKFLVGPDGINSAIAALGGYAVFFPLALSYALGNGLQDIYDAAAAGDPAAVLTNALNLPGLMTGAFINGNAGGSSSLLNPQTGALGPGLLANLVNYIPPTWAESIVAPNAVNIADGGSLAGAYESFVNLLVTGWPPPQEFVGQLLNNLQYWFGPGGNFGSAAAAAATAFDPSIAANLASIAPSVAAEIGGIAPSIAADLSGIAPSIATNIAGTLAPELGTLTAMPRS